ncbi:MAG: VOC family protein [bacterium]|nr:VOC family protein [bacterium]
MLSIATLRLSRLNLGVNDLDAAERFYGGLLGLPTVREHEQIEVRWPTFLLVLSLRPPSDRAKFHFGFAVESAAEVDAWARRLRDGGAELISGPATDGPLRKLFFLDPDGYEIEIYSEAR